MLFILHAIPTLENLRRKHVIEHGWCVHDSQVKLNVDGAIFSDIQTTIIRNDMWDNLWWQMAMIDRIAKTRTLMEIELEAVNSSLQLALYIGF